MLMHASVFAGGFDVDALGAVTGIEDPIEVLTHVHSLVRKSLVVASRTRTPSGTACSRPSVSSPSTSSPTTGGLDDARDRHAAWFARGEGALGRVERSRVPRCGRLGGDRVREPACRVPLERGTGRPRDGGRRRCARGHDRRVGGAVRGGGLGRGDHRRGGSRRHPSSAAVYTAAGYSCFTGRPEAGVADAQLAQRLEADARYDGFDSGWAMFIEALAQVYCGRLDDYLELTRLVADLPGSARGARPARVRGWSPGDRTGRRGARAGGGGRRRRAHLRQRVVDRVCALGARVGVRAS